MKKITIEQALKLLNNASAVIIDDDALMYPSLGDYLGEDDNTFLYMSWVDGDGLEFEVKIREGRNKEIEWEAPLMTLIDLDGNTVTLTLLSDMTVKEAKEILDN